MHIQKNKGGFARDLMLKDLRLYINVYIYIYIHTYIYVYRYSYKDTIKEGFHVIWSSTTCDFIYICTYIYIHKYMYTYMHVQKLWRRDCMWSDAQRPALIYMCTYINIHTYIHVCIHILYTETMKEGLHVIWCSTTCPCIYMYIYKYTYIHTYIHVCIHIYIYRNYEGGFACDLMLKDLRLYMCVHI